jgi:hypothetical protein
MRAEVRSGVIAGPLQATRCRRAGAAAGSSDRLAFDCTAEAGDVNYLFQGVVQPGARRVTVCKHDLAPIRGMNVPVSSRCR